MLLGIVWRGPAVFFGVGAKALAAALLAALVAIGLYAFIRMETEL